MSLRTRDFEWTPELETAALWSCQCLRFDSTMSYADLILSGCACHRSHCVQLCRSWLRNCDLSPPEDTTIVTATESAHAAHCSDFGLGHRGLIPVSELYLGATAR
jgi:hypothetical protein